MSGRIAVAGLAALAWIGPVLTGGCKAPTSSASKSRDPAALRPVSLPDVSQMTESVREQIRERYSSLLKLEIAGTTSEVANAYGALGKLLMAAEHVDAAEPCYLNAQTLAPADARWPYYLGHLFRKKGELEQSAKSFERALELGANDEATLVWLGDAYLAQGRPGAAEPLFSKALLLQPRSVAARFGLGRAALANKDYADAVKHLESALALDGHASAVHYPLAMAYRGLGDTRRAEAHLRVRSRDEVAIRPADPLMDEIQQLVQNSLAYEVRGTRGLDTGDWKGAADYFRKGLELDPANPSLRHRLGTSLVMMGDDRGAVEQFEGALRVSPDYAKAHYSLGVIMEANGRDQDAIHRYSAAVTSEPSYVEARLRLAAILRRSGRLQESLSQYEQVIKTDRRVFQASFGHAMVLVRLGRYLDARDRLAEGMTTYRDQPGFAHALARLLAAAPDDRVRDGQRAMAVMQTLPADQRRMDMGETMAMTLAESGKYDEAAEWQRQAMAAAARRGQDVLAQRMAENLTLYENHHPCRTPWRDGEMP